MQSQDKEFLNPRAGLKEKIGTMMTNRLLTLVVLVAGLALLQACSGNANNITSSTTGNPAPGVTLQAIQISPASKLIGLAESRQLTATGVYSDGASIDISSQVQWTASTPGGGSTNFVAVNSKGVATGMAIGTGVVNAVLGSVTGILQLEVETNGYTSNTIAVLSVPYKTTILDAAYVAESQTKLEGTYAVQEVNLDADQFTNVIPVPVALLGSIPMPSGFVPNVTVANQSNFLVAVISYSSPNIQIIDASNLPGDVAANTVISTFTAPVTQKVTFNGITCMICAAALNPLNGQLLLSTAQGFYSMDMVAGTFTALAFTPTPAPASNFSINPVAASPYILASSASTSEVQMLNLSTNAVTTLNSGVTAPASTALDLISNYGAVVDGATNNESLVDLSNPPAVVFTPVSPLGYPSGCPTPAAMNMAAMGVSAAPTAEQTIATLFTSQASGNCAGFQSFPATTTVPLSLTTVTYLYGPMPSTPDGNAFSNGGDPNTIATFNDVYSGSHTNYGLLEDANQQWLARVNFGSLGSSASGLNFIPQGETIPPLTLCAGTGAQCPTGSVVFLPVPATEVTLSLSSINFGTVAIGTATPVNSATVANIGPNILSDQITLGGSNPGNFQLQNSCDITLQPHANCALGVIFAPTTTGAVSATVTVTAGTEPTQTLCLLGNGATSCSGN